MMKMCTFRFLFLVVMVLVGVGIRGVEASIYTVDSTADLVDTTPGNDSCSAAGGFCTLRAAVMESNAHVGTDQIRIPAGTYNLSLVGAGEDAAATGDLDITGTVVISHIGAGTVIIAGSGDRVFHIITGDVAIADVTIQGGNVTGIGGGIFNSGSSLSLNHVIVKNNSATVSAGGINTVSVLVMDNCTMYLNGAPTAGGLLVAGGAANVHFTTISGNNVGTDGGGIKVVGGTLTISNSTVSGNTAGSGGGIDSTGGVTNLNNVTIANNTAATGAGLLNTVGTVNMRNTLIGDNNGDDCLGGAFSAGNNLVENITGCAVAFGSTDITGLDPKLKPLGFYGGVTQTHALKASSPAIDKGDSLSCQILDQRSLDRTGIGTSCDIGAYEFTCMSYGTNGPTDPLGPGDVENLSYDPNNLQVLYAAWNDLGAWKSTDQGASWFPINNGIVGVPYVTDIRVDPTNGNVLYAACNTDMFKSTDAGANWSALNTGVVNPNYSAVVINPLNTQILYSSSYGFGIYKSTDGGGTWNPANNGISPSHMFIHDLAIDPVNPQKVYFATNTGSYIVYHTLNSGGLWSAVTVAAGNGGGIALDPRNPNILYGSKFPEGALKSTDSGLTWNVSNSGIPTPAQGDDIVVDPTNPSVVYLASAGNVFRSSDAGATWESQQSGIQENSLLAIMVHPSGMGTPFTGGVDSGVFALNVPSQYCDDFEDGDASDWTAIGHFASWSVVAGDLVGTTTKKGDDLAPYIGCVSCSVDAQFSMQTGARASVHGWYGDKKNRVELLVMEDKDKVVLKVRSGGILIGKKATSVFMTGNTVYHFSISYDGSKFTVYKDSSQLYTLNASSGVGSGKFGFRVKTAKGIVRSAAFEEIIVH